jgi:hypothetical protein
VVVAVADGLPLGYDAEVRLLARGRGEVVREERVRSGDEAFEERSIEVEDVER